ncbi:Glucose--fructose oxidoreductase precursor [Pseudobythopirellula maris]|uniref:Glucose--fructose oxidoreductase n=1 Tax=Pseudobythopirellula maris TaxID=2527991 RepID=A0A5C5ZKE1_9BACT|nr:Gfo/Idh/MocA family oxidoreductase [Pseudobythopirellula maris]TWT86883.1 Glucose--fructose oxidoreductase precursor [Pseudobythopirellula maris]
MDLSPEEKQIGKDNYQRVMGEGLLESRRDFLKELTLAGTVVAGGVGAAYFGYDKKLGDPVRIGIIGTGDQGNVLMGSLNPDYVTVKAIADIRPYSVHRAFHGDAYSTSALKARPGLIQTFGYANEKAAKAEIDVYQDYHELLERDDIEAVIIALPLWLHDVAAIAAMQKGKHVLTEKLMAHSVAQCKEMARVADATGTLLATGHQRHYSILYGNAVDTIKRGLIGDIHHLRAQWHRGNLPGKDSWQPPLPTEPLTKGEVDQLRREARKISDAAEQAVIEKYKIVLELDSWSRKLAEQVKPSDIALWEKKVAQKRAQLDDLDVNATKYGYQPGTVGDSYERSALEELIRWRLWNRTGGGLMAELGSHQLDAAGIFISSQFEGKTKVRPLAVSGSGQRSIFPHDRDVDDHVVCTYEYPGKGYFEDNDPTKAAADESRRILVSYSSINGNGYGGYGEVVLGTEGTLILEREQETMLYSGAKTRTSVKVGDKSNLVESYETGGGQAAVAAAAVEADVSRGYREEIEHWAWCIRNGEPSSTLHCNPKVALADAVVALTSNIAMDENRRVEFDPAWFDPDSDATPEGKAPRKAGDITIAKA